jgi:hypothetical protein
MSADGIVIALVALADLGLLVYLRRRRGRRIREARMMQGLRFAIHREANVQSPAMRRNRWTLRRAS